MKLPVRSSSRRIGPQSLLFLGALRPQSIISFSSIPARAMAKSADRSQKFWDGIADGYAKKPIEDEAAYQKKLQVTQQYFRPDMRVLEIGCGTGGTALIHAPHVKHIEAIDISSKMIEIANGKARDKGVQNVTFRQSTIDDLRIPDGSLDVVLGLSILHLLEDRNAAIAKVYRMLKPGGIFVTSTPCIADMGVGSRFLCGVILPVGQFFGILPTIQLFTKSGLKDSMTNAGFGTDYEWHPAKGKVLFMIAKKCA